MPSKQDREKLVDTFISNRLDYCKGGFQKSVQISYQTALADTKNTAARILTGSQKS